MKSVLPLLLVLITIGASAQIKPKKRLYKDEKVFEYPVVLSAYADEEEPDIPYLYDSLPDGKYIILKNNYAGEEVVGAEFNVVNGKAHGEIKWTSGVTMGYQNGIPHGDLVHRDLYGNIVFKTQLVNGLKQGPFQRYAYKNSKDTTALYLKEDGHFTDGYLYGERKIFYPTGQLMYYYSNYGGERKKRDYELTTYFQYYEYAGFYNAELDTIYDQMPDKKSLKNQTVELEWASRGLISPGFFNGTFIYYAPNGTLKYRLETEEKENGHYIKYSTYLNNSSTGHPRYRTKVDSLDSTSNFYVSEFSSKGHRKVRKRFTTDGGEYDLYSTTYYSKNRDGDSLVQTNLNQFNLLVKKQYPDTIPLKTLCVNDSCYSLLDYYNQYKEDIKPKEKKYDVGSKFYRLPAGVEVKKIQGDTVQLKRWILDENTGVQVTVYRTFMDDDHDQTEVPFNFYDRFFKKTGNHTYSPLTSRLTKFTWDESYSTSSIIDDSVEVKLHGELFTGTFIIQEAKKTERVGTFDVMDDLIVFYANIKYAPEERESFREWKRDWRYISKRRRSQYIKGIKRKFRRSRLRKSYRNRFVTAYADNDYDYKATFESGIPHGVYTTGFDTLFYENGQLKLSKEYTAFKRQKGKVFKRLTDYKEYEAGVLHGKYREFYLENNWTSPDIKRWQHKLGYSLSEWGQYENGERVGEYVWFSDRMLNALPFEKSRDIYELSYSIDTFPSYFPKDGVSEYDSLGRLIREREFDYDGSLEEDFNYKEGVAHGPQVLYDLGDTMVFFNYKDGLLDGAYFKKHENGTFKSIGYFENGLAKGDWYYYNRKGGALKAVLTVDSIGVEPEKTVEIEITRRSRYEAPDLKHLEDYKVSGKIKHYYNGMVFEKGGLLDGVPNGDWWIYNQSGQLIEYRNFNNNTDLAVGDYALINKGDTIAEGVMYNKQTKYDCASDLDIDSYDKTYTYLINDFGDSTVVKWQGYAEEKDEFGQVIAKGKIKQGLKLLKTRWLLHSK